MSNSLRILLFASGLGACCCATACNEQSLITGNRTVLAADADGQGESQMSGSAESSGASSADATVDEPVMVSGAYLVNCAALPDTSDGSQVGCAFQRDGTRYGGTVDAAQVSLQLNDGSSKPADASLASVQSPWHIIVTIPKETAPLVATFVVVATIEAKEVMFAAPLPTAADASSTVPTATATPLPIPSGLALTTLALYTTSSDSGDDGDRSEAGQFLYAEPGTVKNSKSDSWTMRRGFAFKATAFDAKTSVPADMKAIYQVSIPEDNSRDSKPSNVVGYCFDAKAAADTKKVAGGFAIFPTQRQGTVALHAWIPRLAGKDCGGYIFSPGGVLDFLKIANYKYRGIVGYVVPVK